MSKKEIRKLVLKEIRLEELRKLNAVIDAKIRAGKPYKIHAMVHAALVRSLA